MDAFEILVVLLSITLAIFLILAIAVMVQLLKIVRSAQYIASQLETTADNLASASDIVRKNAKPAVMMATIGSLVKSFVRKKTK